MRRDTSNRMSLFLYLRGKELQSPAEAVYFDLFVGLSVRSVARSSVTAAAGALRGM
jgi:hypothetical protein